MFLNMATLNFLTDNIEEAESCLSQAETQAGSSEEPAIALALIYLNLRQGNTEAALKVLKKRRAEGLRAC